MNIATTKWLGAATMLFLVAACGGGGSTASGGGTTYTVSVTVTGMRHSYNGLTLRNNGGDDLRLFGDGSSSFNTALASGATYAVTVSSQPTGPDQTCTVSSGSGTIGTANVSNVAIDCPYATAYAVGGTVSGLTGTGLDLQYNKRRRDPHLRAAAEPVHHQHRDPLERAPRHRSRLARRPAARLPGQQHVHRGRRVQGDDAEHLQRRVPRGRALPVSRSGAASAAPAASAGAGSARTRRSRSSARAARCRSAGRRPGSRAPIQDRWQRP
jgi:hypothetical protein